MGIRKPQQEGIEQADLFNAEYALEGTLTQSFPLATDLAWNGSGATVTSTAATGNQDIDGLLSTQHWSSTSISFSFPTSASQYGTYTTGELSTFQAVNAQMANAARWVLTSSVGSTYYGVSMLALTENTGSPGSATIRISMSDSASPTAYAYYPSNGVWGGDVWMGTQTNSSVMTNPVRGNYAFHAMMHELGHALGLKHGQDTGGVSNVAMTSAHDDMEYSIMTYRSYVGASTSGGYTNEQWGYAQSLMMYDIAAIQSMYGAWYGAGHTYSWSPTTGEEFIDGVGQGAPGANRVFMTVWDGGTGNNGGTYDLSNYTTNLSIDLTPGGYSVLSSAQLAYLGNNHYARGNVYNALLYGGNVQSEINNCHCGSGNDTITLTGDNVNNTIDGGVGTDTVYVTYNYNSGYTISGSISSFTLTGSAGIDTLSHIEYVHFADGSTYSIAQLIGSTVAPHDFNHDGNSDILWRNTNGVVSLWEMNGSQNPVAVGSWAVGADWQIAGTGDFNNDGNSDILWRNTNGAVTLWEMNGSQNPVAVGGWSVGNDWQIAGTGDFNHDGNSDILWRNANGVVSLWEMNGAQSPTAVGGWAAGNDWQIAGIGDFNHDGNSDVLWRNTNGVVSLWEMNGAQSPVAVGAWGVGNDWQIAGTGDFNGDGNSDILWRNTNGVVSLWEMNGAQSPVAVGSWAVGNDWRIAGTGDFNHDGISDILWRNTNGAVSLWEMNGSQNPVAVGAWGVGNDWQIGRL
jgi:hypothetical protein